MAACAVMMVILQVEVALVYTAFGVQSHHLGFEMNKWGSILFPASGDSVLQIARPTNKCPTRNAA